MADKQLIIVVEGTSALGPYWKSIVSDYLDKIIRSFCANDTTLQKSSGAAPGSTFELALVMFTTHGPYSGSSVQRSGWTRDMDNFLGWLTSLSFSGGGWCDAATAEGLSEALMMFAIPQNGFQTQQNLDGKRHCILVSASNPYPLPTPVYRPAIETLDQGENDESHSGNVLFDADTVSKWFGQCSVSLSVICPKQLPKLRALYNAAKRSQRTSEPVVDVKQPHYLVLLSDGFSEACAALSRSGVPPSQNPVSSLHPGSGPPVSSPSANGSSMIRPPTSNGNLAPAIVKVEPSTVTSIGSGPAHPHMPSMPRAAAPSVPSLQASSPPSVSQETTSNNESAPDLKPMVSMSQNIKPAGARSLLNSISNIRGAALSGITSLGMPSVGGNPIGTHMSNVISSGMASTGSPQTVLSSGQSDAPAVSGSGTVAGISQPLQNTAINSFNTATSNVSNNSNLGVSQPASNVLGSVNNPMGSTMTGISQGNVPLVSQSGNNMNPNTMPSLGTNGGPSGTGSMMLAPGIMNQQAQQGLQSVGMNNSVSNMSMSQQGPSSLPSSQSKYVKVWEGNLSGQRQQQPVFITKLEGYRNATASETLAANWPPTMQIVRLISQDHMNNKQYVGKADFLVFRAMNQHGFLSQLQEKKLCAVIQLPSQTLLLSVSDKACRLIGMLFPGDMVVFKPQIPSQQQQQQLQHQQLQQQQQQQQHPQLQQQQLQHMQQQQNMQQLQQLQQQPTMQLQQQPQQHIPQLQQQMSQLQQFQQQQQQQIPQQLQQQQLQQQPQQQQQQQIPQLQQQLQQQQQQQQQQQLQQQMQQQSQSQQMAGGGMGQGQGQGQGYMQGQSRPQLVPQGQVPSQGTPPNMGGGGFMG